VEGHSHYFLRDPLTIVYDPAFPVKTEELRASSTSLQQSSQEVHARTRTIYGLRSDLATGTEQHPHPSLRAQGRREDQTGGPKGDFPLEPMRDSYHSIRSLPPLETQRDLLEAIALQIAEQLTLDNGPIYPKIAWMA
jgi:hypothetical protein